MTEEGRRFAADFARLASDIVNPLFAVSGGPDSMAMLTLAHESLPPGFTVASIDHRLRPEAVEESAMVAAYCATLGISHATLAPSEPITGASIQAQARTTRYALLTEHARAIGAGALVTGHHADDQAETFLMRAARGSGLAGLAGVRARTHVNGVIVIRPLLDWRRAELRAIVRRAEVPFLDDPSNHDDRHDRTRFRRLLGENEWLGTPNLARAAAALAETDTDVRAMVDWVWTERAKVGGGEVKLAVENLPREILRRLARRAIGTVRAEAGIVAPEWTEAANIEKLLDSLTTGKRTTQAGIIASVRGDVWRFREAPPRRVLD
ncbi:tRNA lysidine(34) synthetase TilS [Sphingomonas sp. Leaf242]|uniref:tRNA lysidine(34) synthetase TilS n=1 Tax=Sphingomonas sp. Leaf242 TaxID=1736304 RepID=UPI0007152ACE|nr:tRNA lysidine(34) synthetase TilS [Sphingomonas sp. Leaf242]KQO06971.1 tRNA(Ile)-lysidine synthetase [Sphingomonas sp. Leaf242]